MRKLKVVLIMAVLLLFAACDEEQEGHFAPAPFSESTQEYIDYVMPLLGQDVQRFEFSAGELANVIITLYTYYREELVESRTVLHMMGDEHTLCNGDIVLLTEWDVANSVKS